MHYTDFNLDKTDKYHFIILFIFAFLSTLKMTLFCLAGGILNPDISLYLLSALKYAGMDYFNVVNPTDLYFTPVISFLTSLLIRMGLVDHSSIIIVTSIFGFFSYIGLYILLRNRFNPLLSLTGVFIYGSFSLVFFNISKGMIDIPAMSISIWILIFAIMAVDVNPRYYLIALPLLAIGFFVKYTVGFMLPIILLYYVMNKDVVNLLDGFIHDRSYLKQNLVDYIKSREFKYIFASIIITVIIGLLICKTLILDFGGSLSFLSQSANTFNGFHFSANSVNYDPSKSAYLKVIPKILFQQRSEMVELTCILFGILGLGILIKIIDLVKNRACIRYFIDNRKHYKTGYFELLCVAVFVLSTIGMLVFFKKSNHMYSNICALIAITVAYSLSQKLNLKNRNVLFFLLFLGYFAVSFIFIAIYEIKVFRYCLILIPPFIFFIVWGLESIMDFISNGLDTHEVFKSKLCNDGYGITYSKVSKILLVAVVLVFLISTIVFIAPMQMDNQNELYPDVNKHGFVTDLQDACEFIKNNDSNYHNKTFEASNYHARTARWYLNDNVTVLDWHQPKFKDYDNSTYLILESNRSFNNYHIIQTCGDIYIYHHN